MTPPVPRIDVTALEPDVAVPPLRRTITQTDMVAYAGATWDWHQLHYDPTYLAAKKLPAAVVDGQVFGALLVEQVQDWIGPAAWVRAVDFRFKNLVFAGETVECTAKVREVFGTDEGTMIVLDCEVGVVGEKSRVAAAPCSVTVLVR
jgi:acyl dehydratase